MVRFLPPIPGLALYGLTAFAIISHLLLNFRLPVPAVIFPACICLAMLPLFRRQTAPETGTTPPRRGLIIASCLVILICLIPVTYSCLQGTNTAIDAHAAWTPRAKVLALEPTLEQPFFRQLNIFHHSRSYPLLQSLLLASTISFLGYPAGTILFPLLFLFMFASVWEGFSRRGTPAWLAACFSLTLCLTPMFINPGAGAVDSGYGEFFLVLVMTNAALGLLNRDPLRLAATLLLLPLIKPEGLVYAGLFCFITLFTGDRKTNTWAWGGFCLSLLLWLPLHFSLVNPTSSISLGTTFPTMAGLFGGAILLKIGLAKTTGRPRLTILVALLLGAAFMLLPQLLEPVLTQHGGALFTIYFAQTNAIWANLDLLPPIIHQLLYHLVLVDKYAFVFLLVIILPLLPRTLVGPCPSRALAGLLFLALLITIFPFLVPSEGDLGGHLRSRMDRLLLHWIGVAWVLVAIWLERVFYRDLNTCQLPGGPACPPHGQPDSV